MCIQQLPRYVSRCLYCVAFLLPITWSACGSSPQQGNTSPSTEKTSHSPTPTRTSSKAPLKIWNDPTAWVKQVAWSPDSKLFASVGPKAYGELSKVFIRDTASGSKVNDYQLGISDSIGHMQWSPDGTLIAFSSTYGFEVRDSFDGDLLYENGKSKEDQEGASNEGLSWAPDSKRLALSKYIYGGQSNTGEGLIQVVDIITKQVLFEVKQEADYYPEVSWSPDGTLLVTNARNELLFLDANTGELLFPIPIPLPIPIPGVEVQQTDPITDLDWSPNGAYLAATTLGGKSLVWDIPSQKLILETKGAYAQQRNAWSPDSQRIATIGASQERFFDDHQGYDVMIWQVTTGKRVMTYLGHDHIIHCLAWSPDGKMLASGTYYGNIHIWEP